MIPSIAFCTTSEEVRQALGAGSLPIIRGNPILIDIRGTIIVAEGSPLIQVKGDLDLFIITYCSSSPQIYTYDVCSPYIVCYDQSAPGVQAFDSSKPHIRSGGYSTPSIRAKDDSRPVVVACGFSHPYLDGNIDLQVYEHSQPTETALGIKVLINCEVSSGQPPKPLRSLPHIRLGPSDNY